MKETWLTGKGRSTTIAATPDDGKSQRKRRYQHCMGNCERVTDTNRLVTIIKPTPRTKEPECNPNPNIYIDGEWREIGRERERDRAQQEGGERDRDTNSAR